jgi:hypothetical protein
VVDKTSAEIEQLVVEVRRKFESSEVGLIGARAIWGKLIELKSNRCPVKGLFNASCSGIL